MLVPETKYEAFVPQERRRAEGEKPVTPE